MDTRQLLRERIFIALLQAEGYAPNPEVVEAFVEYILEGLE